MDLIQLSNLLSYIYIYIIIYIYVCVCMYIYIYNMHMFSTTGSVGLLFPGDFSQFGVGSVDLPSHSESAVGFPAPLAP